MPTQEHDSWLGALGVDFDKARDWAKQKVDEVKEDVNKAEDFVKDEVKKGVDFVKTEANAAIDEVKKGVDYVKKEAGKAVDEVKKDAAALKQKAVGDQSGKPVPRPMEGDCKPEHGYVPGPKNHLLCATHGHVVDTDQQMIIANSVASYVKEGVSNLAKSAAADVSGDPNAASNLVSSLPNAVSASAGGGFNLEIEAPLAKTDVDLGSKVKGEIEGSAKGSAKVQGGGAATVTLDKNGWGAKVTQTIWSSKAKATIAGVDFFANPKFDEESSDNPKEQSFKVSFSVETPIGKLAAAAIPFKIAGEKSELAAFEGSLEGIPYKFGETDVEGISFSDVELCFTCKFTVSPEWTKIITDELRQRALNILKNVATDAAFELVLDGGLILVAVAVVAATANELSKAAEERQIPGTVAFCYNGFIRGLRAGLCGDDKRPSDEWGAAGYDKGHPAFVTAFNKYAQDMPNATIDDIADAAAKQAHKIEASVDAGIKAAIGKEFFKAWVKHNHGVGTFLGDAERVCGMCYQEGPVSENDSRLKDWKDVTVLPGFMT
jgi:hypothetical protein